MLCVGIVKHGYGAWSQIRDDEELGLRDKFFLEEHRVEKKEERSKVAEKAVKSPGAVHLVRRADYLLSVLKEKTSNGTNLAAKRAVENHHRNNKKNGMYAKITDARTSVSASPAPSAARKVHRESEKHRSRNSIERRVSTGERNGHTPRSDVRPRPSSDHVRHEERHHHSPHHHRHSNENDTNGVKVDKLMWKLFTPVQGSLKAVQGATKDRLPEKAARANVLRVELVKIGDLVADLVKDPDPSEEDDGLEASFW